MKPVFLAALALAVATPLFAQTPWIHVEVIETGEDDTRVNVNLPLSVVQVALDAAWGADDIDFIAEVRPRGVKNLSPGKQKLGLVGEPPGAQAFTIVGSAEDESAHVGRTSKCGGFEDSLGGLDHQEQSHAQPESVCHVLDHARVLTLG